MNDVLNVSAAFSFQRFDKELREGVELSRKFYNLTFDNGEHSQLDSIPSYIAESIRHFKYPPAIAAMCQGVYWRRRVSNLR